MNVSYTGPLQRAWARSQRMLFKPFHIVTWLVLGFAAFLSEGLGGWGRRGPQISHKFHPSEFPLDWFEGVRGLLSGFLMTGLGMLILAAALVLVVVMIWVNCRGRFVFLDDVVNGRAAIVEPWKRHGHLGNSLFLWWLGFLLACVAVSVLIALPFLATIFAIWSGGEFHWGMLGALWTLMAIAFPLAIVGGYVVLFLFDFVVPIMYRQNVGVTVAWSRFLSLFRAHPGSFLLYGLFVVGLSIGVGVILIVIGFMSCCVGFALFSLPYVSSVVLLPILVTFRALGPEFLGQFGPDYMLFAAAPAPTPTPPAPSGSPPAPAAPAPSTAPPPSGAPPPAPEGGTGG